MRFIVSLSLHLGVSEQGDVLVSRKEITKFLEKIMPEDFSYARCNFGRLNANDPSNPDIVLLEEVLEKVKKEMWRKSFPNCNCIRSALVKYSAPHRLRATDNPDNPDIPMDPDDLGFVLAAEVF